MQPASQPPFRAPIALLQRRLDGASMAALGREIGMHPVALHRALSAAHLGQDDMRDLRDPDRLAAVQIRPCLSCGRLIASPHIGVRMCQPCRDGVGINDDEDC